MPIYRSSRKENFVNEVIEFIFSRFHNHLHKVKVILPNGYLCDHLQKNIIEKFGTTILPAVIPINSVNSEKDETFKIPSKQIEKVTNLEEKMILAKIINSYNKLSYNLSQSLSLASSLSRLFFEFEANNVDFKILKDVPVLDQPEHWHFIYDFLEFAYENWQIEIAKIKKLTSAQHQKLMFNAEIARLKASDNYTIIAGVIGNNQLIQDFISELSKLSNGYIILPPLTAHVDDWSTETFTPENALYSLMKLIKRLEVDIKKIPYLSNPAQTIFDDLLVRSPVSTNSFINNIKYAEFDNIMLEAEHVAATCLKYLHDNANARIAILITNDATKTFFTAKLERLNLKFLDLIGDNIMNLLPITLIFEVAENICRQFSVRNFVSLILHPLIISDETMRLKRFIAKQNRFAQNIEDIYDIIDNNFTDQNSQEKLKNICKVVENKALSKNFSELLKKTLKAAESICPTLWSSPEDDKIADGLAEIIKVNWSASINEPEAFPNILKELISGGRIYDNRERKANITICSPNEVTLINYDLIIYTNFINNSYPLPLINSPWLNNHMIKEIGLESWAARTGNTLYDFYLNLHNKHVLITCALKSENSSNNLPSPFLFRLKHILGNKFERINNDALYNSSIKQLNVNEEYAYSSYFPPQISVTDIETLIRAPYNFYAKKILNLKPEPELEETHKLSEFGSFFHKVIELYTKNFNEEQNQTLRYYAEEVLSKSIYPSQTRKSWQAKIEALEEEFTQFDNLRRNQKIKVFSEVRGELEMDIAGQKIKIVAIADRIELTPAKKAIIIDYKTGSLPTCKEVLSGLSPQLMIEAIMLLEGGFKELGTEGIEAKDLIYVKFGSRAPFITTLVIPITKEEILRHKQGLINLLSYYITTSKYKIEPNLMNYDDYKYLARRM